MEFKSEFRGRRCARCRTNVTVAGGSQQARNLYLIDQLAPKSQHPASSSCCHTTTSRLPGVLSPCQSATPKATLSLNFLVYSGKPIAGGQSYPRNFQKIRSLRYLSTNVRPGPAGIEFYCYLHQRSCHAVRAVEASAFTHLRVSEKLEQEQPPLSQHVINCTPQTTSLQRLRQRILAANRCALLERSRSSASKLSASVPQHLRLQAVTEKEYTKDLLVDAETLDAIKQDAFLYVSMPTRKKPFKRVEGEPLPVSAEIPRYTETPSAPSDIKKSPPVQPILRANGDSEPLVTLQDRTTTARKFKKSQPRCRRPSLSAPTSSLTNHRVQDDEAYQRLFDEERDFLVDEHPNTKGATVRRGPSTESVPVDSIKRKASPPSSVARGLDVPTVVKSSADWRSISSSTSSTSSVSSSMT